MWSISVWRNLSRFSLQQSKTTPLNSQNFRQISAFIALTRKYHASSIASKPDFYEVLGLTNSATKDEIKKKFRELAKKYHPDLNKDDKTAEKKFKEISEAYEVLEDDQKRQQYDAFGHAGVDPNYQQPGGDPFGGFGGFNGGFRVHSNMQGIDPEDIFNLFQQAMGGNGGSTMGQDVQTAVSLSFLEAVNGCTKNINYEYFIREPVAGRRNAFQKVRRTKQVKIDIPPGIDSGTTVRVQGKGGEGVNGTNTGDLFVNVEVKEDPYFKRRNQDVHVEVPITIAQAILGGDVDVLTLDGMVSMKVPSGSQPDTQLMLKGKGIRSMNNFSKRGNQYVKLKVTVPTRLTERQKELIREFSETSTSASSTGKTEDKDAAKNTNFTINQAWKRVKDFLSSNSAKDNSSSENKDKGSKVEEDRSEGVKANIK